MGKWADIARQIDAREPNADSANSANSCPNGTNGTIGAASENVVRPTEAQARAMLRHWHARLSALNFDTAPDGFTLKRWQQLVDDAEWLYENHAGQLVRDGWTAHDIFGVLPWREGGGVLLDRLRGARNLMLDGEGRAFWKSYGVTFFTSRDMGDALVSSGLRLVWELSRCG